HGDGNDLEFPSEQCPDLSRPAAAWPQAGLRAPFVLRGVWRRRGRQCRGRRLSVPYRAGVGARRGRPGARRRGLELRDFVDLDPARPLTVAGIARPHLGSRSKTDEVRAMQFGASIFFTDYSITPTALAAAMEERGFESLWAAEHSHIPVPRRTPAPGGGELAKRYYDVMDPFVTLTAAAAVTRKLKLATGICLVIQRDTIQTAKLVASIDQ